MRSSRTVILMMALVGLALAAPPSSSRAGNEESGRPIEKGKWAYLLPPTTVQGDHQTVVVSAPHEKWIVGGGPYNSKDACEHSRSLATSEADSQLSAAKANAYGNPAAQAAALTYQHQGMQASSALALAVDEITWRERLLAMQRGHSVCAQSDGSTLFRVPQPVQPDPNAPYGR